MENIENEAAEWGVTPLELMQIMVSEWVGDQIGLDTESLVPDGDPYYDGAYWCQDMVDTEDGSDYVLYYVGDGRLVLST